MRKFLLVFLVAVVLVVGGAVVLVVGGIAAFVAMQPEDSRIERKITIDAPAAVVFAQVNDFHNWEAWSPWAKLDPDARVTFEGPKAGKGAIFQWAGNDEVGEGMMTVKESRPNELIRIQLDFIKPFAGTSTSEFTFRGDGGKTVVTWTMSGKNGFLEKAACLIMDMEVMVGGKFEEGLANMKSVVEAKKTK